MFFSYPDGAALLPYNTIRASMKVWRRAIYPRQPETLAEFALQLADPANELILQYHSGQLKSTLLRDANNDIHLFLWDQQFLSYVEMNISHFFIDGTFQTTPNMNGVYQLVTLMGIFHGHVSII